ncbi:hypothetical protein [Halostreptopolyspora alba]|uniref:Uncharacterized protein n=1 Tax=Halostreptopolyspora alba TaxID=2487137 RepID=A0A3N0E8S1_9ACTN|nr:hypothetical protein EFW17_13565 [Nocardiopsaceae bacterium YIM 96095]
MRTWVRTSAQTVMLTAGLVLLGTGVASAQSVSVDSDQQPPTPTDLIERGLEEIGVNGIG